MYPPQPRASHRRQDKPRLRQLAGDLRLIYPAPTDASFDDLLGQIGRLTAQRKRA
jgi:hypothetical protein